MNRETAIANQLLNQTNQVGPNGSLTYNQIGDSQYWADAQYDEAGNRIEGTGELISIPRYEAVTELSPEQQVIYDQNTALAQQLNTLAGEQTDRISGVLSSPIDLSNEATEQRLFELGRSRLDPMFDDREDQLRTRLSNQGIGIGTEAYDREMERFSQGKNDAYNNLLLSGRGQSIQEALTERNQPINEISALMSGGQVSMPQFTQTPQSNVAGVDYAGLVQDKYAADYAAYQNDVNNRNSALGGLFGLGSSLLGGWAYGGF